MNSLWPRQIAAVMRIELGKILGRRSALLIVFAALPVLLSLLARVLLLPGDGDDVTTAPEIAIVFANLFQWFVLPLVFLACVWIFISLTRGEILERSLHYYFLVPIRREILIAGKYLSGWIATSLLFTASALASMGVLFGYLGASQAADYLLRGPGLGLWTGYAGVTVLACLGYGAVFLLVGIFLRNPIVPALVLFVWEAINAFLPPLLKKFSVIFYLFSMLPLRTSEGTVAIVADPIPPWLAVPGLVSFSFALLVVSGWKARSMEISYGSD